jgi:protein ImuA
MVPGPVPEGRQPLGVAAIDAALAGGLERGRVHEVHAAQDGDAAAAAGFVVAVATRMAGDRGNSAPVLWLRSRRAAHLGGAVQANGWAELGGAPGRGLVGIVPDALALLRAAHDAVRVGLLGAVIVESWGTMRELDLTASRRLALAAEKSGVPLFLLRADADPVPSAAQTRWQVASAPSHALPGNAPGRPTFDLTLLRQRSGPCGLNWRVEWDRDRCEFHDAAPAGAAVSPPAIRAMDDGEGEGDRYAA